MAQTIEIDLDGKIVGVPRDVVSELAAAAAARAGISERHRDLSIRLNGALESGSVSLGQRDSAPEPPSCSARSPS